jgi:hypothetical protein
MTMSALPVSLRRPVGALVLAAVFVLSSPAAADQAPFGGWLELVGNTTSGGAGHGYVEIPHSTALNPTSAITIELWVRLATPFTGQSCRSLVGKDFTQAYWIGVCGSTLRSYLRGGASVNDGGTIPAGVWTHIAVTSDGVTKRHYINGVQVASFAAGGPNTASTDPVRIGSDVSWQFSPAGEIDEVRIWNIVLTASEILEFSASPVLADTPGLVAVWSFDMTLDEKIGGFDSSGHGEGNFVIAAVPAGDWITVPSLGLSDFRFKARINGSTTGTEVLDCVPDTVCVAGAIPSRSEIFVRIIGPRPNGYLHLQITKFTTSRVEVWVERLSTGEIRYYELASVPSETFVLPGIVDKEAFLP